MGGELTAEGRVVDFLGGELTAEGRVVDFLGDEAQEAYVELVGWDWVQVVKDDFSVSGQRHRGI
jgi:hypothetical protein